MCTDLKPQMRNVNKMLILVAHLQPNCSGIWWKGDETATYVREKAQRNCREKAFPSTQRIRDTMEWRRESSPTAPLNCRLNHYCSFKLRRKRNRFEFQPTRNGSICNMRTILWHNNYSNKSTAFWESESTEATHTVAPNEKVLEKRKKLVGKVHFSFVKKVSIGFRVSEEWHFIFMEFESPALSISFRTTRSRFTHGTY